MNTIFRFIFSALFMLFILVACDTDPCEGINCDNGVCDTVTGSCLCSGGYEQDSSGICTVQWSTKMAGNYSVSDSCTGSNPGTTTYSVNVTSTSPKTIDLSTLGSLGKSIMGTHTNSIAFVIDTIFTGGTILTGTGSLVDTTFIINYVVNDTVAGSIDTCMATFSRL